MKRTWAIKLAGCLGLVLILACRNKTASGLDNAESTGNAVAVELLSQQQIDDAFQAFGESFHVDASFSREVVVEGSLLHVPNGAMVDCAVEWTAAITNDGRNVIDKERHALFEHKAPSHRHGYESTLRLEAPIQEGDHKIERVEGVAHLKWPSALVHFSWTAGQAPTQAQAKGVVARLEELHGPDVVVDLDGIAEDTQYLVVGHDAADTPLRITSAIGSLYRGQFGTTTTFSGDLARVDFYVVAETVPRDVPVSFPTQGR